MNHFSRYLAVGDPQTTKERFLRLLDWHALLDGDMLKSDVHLVAVGDYFDFHAKEGVNASEEGLEILRWLAAHSPQQVRILLGNHDVSRVMELYEISDTRFAQARSFTGSAEEFTKQFPNIPTVGIAKRDFSAFSTAQRQLVRELLVSKRAHLATVGLSAYGKALITHAALTNRELALLGIKHCRDPETIALALNDFLEKRVEDAQERFVQGLGWRLDLSELHIMGSAEKGEGGGLLYHRPAAEKEEWASKNARRFFPQDLPKGLLQICGHTQHHKMCSLFAEQSKGMVKTSGQIRSLSCDQNNRIAYEIGQKKPREDCAVVWMIDGSMNKLPPHDVALLELLKSD